MIPKIESISFDVSEDLRIPEYYIEEKIAEDLMLKVRKYTDVSYWESVDFGSTRIVAKVAIMSLEEREELIEYIEKLEYQNEHMLNIINLKGAV